METRILELALEALDAQRETVAAEISAIRGELKGESGVARFQKAGSVTRPPSARRKPRSTAQRKAHSARMKAYWASKRETPAANANKSTPTPSKRRAKTAAEKKAMSLKMKAAWARRRSEATKKSK